MLNALGYHRRSALWEVEEVKEDDLFTSQSAALTTPLEILPSMTPTERLESDYQTLGLTTGPHPMAYIRSDLPGVLCAADLVHVPNGKHVTIAGQVICRQRPGTANGHVFVSLEDETGISNAFVPSTLFEKERMTITQERFLKINGRLQNQENMISVYALKIEALHYHAAIGSCSHDFH